MTGAASGRKVECLIEIMNFVDLEMATYCEAGLEDLLSLMGGTVIAFQ